jgi:hypothetical protein
MFFQQIFRQSAGFPAKDQNILIGKSNIGITGVCLGRIEIKMVSRQFFNRFFIIFINLNIKKVPVIQAGTLQMPVIQGKPQRLYQVQLHMFRCTESGNISCITWDFGINQ